GTSVLTLGVVFFFQAEDGIRDFHVTGVQTCALPILFDELHDLGEYDAAWPELERGMRAKRATLQYDVAEDLRLLEAIRDRCDAEIGRASCREGGEDRGGHRRSRE